MEERFGGVTMQKLECECTQHGVPNNHLADMDGLSVRRRQPRLRYTGVGDKFIVKSEPASPYVGCRVRKEFPTA
jgi:hypothetical protein